MNTQTKMSILTGLLLLITILTALGLSTETYQQDVDTLVAIITEDASGLATEAQVASQTPVVITVVVTAAETTPTPDAATAAPPQDTATPYAGCDVTVRGDWNDFVSIYGGSLSEPDTGNVIDTVASGTILHVDHLYVVKDVEEEYSYIPEKGGWIRNSAFFPVYDLMECWALPSNATYPPTFEPTPGPTLTPITEYDCEVTPSEGLDYVNVRSGPGTWGYVVGTLTEGKTATLLDTAGEWYSVELDTGRTGYIASWVVERSASCD